MSLYNLDRYNQINTLMECSKCSSCHISTPLENLIHCCIPSLLVCRVCRNKHKCISCSKNYSLITRCAINCTCILSQKSKFSRIIS